MKALSILFLFAISISGFQPAYAESTATQKIVNLEKSFDGKIGVYAINTNTKQTIEYRADERFPMQSTMKLIGAAALLKKSESDPHLLQTKIHYSNKDFIPWHPITGKNVLSGMTLLDLAEAAVSYSDNVAINLVIKNLGGPNEITKFARSIGNNSFNLIHDENDLNSNPNKTDDTATPHDMAISVEKLIFGNTLSKSHRTLLTTWMKDNTTGYKRIRAGVPIGWTVLEKTGGGGVANYGIANDIGVAWSPVCKPIILAIYTVQNKENTKSRDDIVASATQIVFEEFEKNSSCFAVIN